ncbi:MAG: hypothetical protein L3J77_05515, partial [Thermoplasmata archaeon]|nr:hypothetical protein [Thermoplasmata archaeon]
VLPVGEDDEILVTTQRGITIRMAVHGIRAQGRNTMGVRVMRLDEGDTVKDALVLPAGLDGNGGEKGEAPTDGPPGASPPPDEDDGPDEVATPVAGADEEDDDEAPAPP